MNWDRIEKLSKQESKSLLERMVKLQEEVGELAQEVLIANQSSGSQYKSSGDDGIQGECIDVILVALSIYFSHQGSVNNLSMKLNSKSDKWEKYQNK